MESRRRHIVMIPFPAQGHVTPMMRLACKLASLGGLRITYVANDGLVKAALASREDCYKDVITVVGISKGAIEARHWKGNSSGFVAMEKASFEMEEPLEQLIRSMQIREGQIQCLIGDSFLPLVQDVANRLGIARMVLWTSSACAAVPNFLIKELHDNDLIPVQEKIATAKGNDAHALPPGLGRYTLRDLPFAFHSPDPEEVQMRIAAMGRIKEATCLLMNTFEELERESVDHLRTTLPLVFPVGPLLPSAEGIDAKNAGGSEDRACLAWLDEQEARSVVYVSFGSLANLSISQMEELAAGLEASEATFLWVVRSNLVVDGSGAAVVGESDAFQRFIRSTKNRGLMVAWAPQLEVLRHPSIALFVTHCGWNSSMEAICSGVPMVAWPCFAEQNVNARFVVSEWGVGVGMESAMSLPGAFVGRDEVERVIRQGMHDEGIKKNALGFQEKAKNAHGDGGSSRSNLEAFVKTCLT